jgi:hypothetical protein
MKRSEFIMKLVKEGFSEKTLSNFNDKQILSLAKTILSEDTVMISKNSPTYQKDMDIAKKSKKTIETYEGKSEKTCTKCGKRICECRGKKYDVKEVLKGGQKKLDMNHNGKLDSQDFKMLNKRKKSEVDESKKILSKKKSETIYDKALKKYGGEKGVLKFFDKEAERIGLKSPTKKPTKIGQKSKLSLTSRKLNEYSDAQKWVENVVENNYHTLTTKNEIMELIKSKLIESDVMDNQPSTKPKEKPNPTVDPVRPKPQKPKRENPFEPGRQPIPKAKREIPDFMKFNNIGIKLKNDN